MIGYRIKFKNIISELYLPQRQNKKVIIFLPGLPSYLGKNEITKNLVAHGYIVFQPFYSGSFDSGGVFTPKQCLNDVKVFLEMARKRKFEELYYGKYLAVECKEVILFGISYGSSIAALSCGLPEISKIVMFSPVLTYQQAKINKYGFKSFNFEFQMRVLIDLLKKGYPYTYRIKDFEIISDFLMGINKNLEPIDCLVSNLNKPLLIFQGGEDSTLPSGLTQKLFQDSKISDKIYKLNIIKDAGHSISHFASKKIIKNILEFI